MQYWIRTDGEVYYTNNEQLAAQEVFTRSNYKHILEIRDLLSHGWIGIIPNYFTEHQNALVTKPGFFNPTEAQVSALSKLAIAPCVVVYAIFEDQTHITLHMPTLKFVADEWYLSEVLPIVAERRDVNV